MKLSEDQRTAARVDTSAFVTACPGAGKTRVVAAKIQREVGAALKTGRNVACITYTNAARDEIHKRTRAAVPHRYMKSIRISTLHGFLLESVLQPWGHLLPDFPKGVRLAAPGSPLHDEAVARAAQYFSTTTEDIKRQTSLYWRGPDGALNGSNPAKIERVLAELANDGAVDFEGVIYYSYQLLREA